jgi:hypothetical protein
MGHMQQEQPAEDRDHPQYGSEAGKLRKQERRDQDDRQVRQEGSHGNLYPLPDPVPDRVGKHKGKERAGRKSRRQSQNNACTQKKHHPARLPV